MPEKPSTSPAPSSPPETIRFLLRHGPLQLDIPYPADTLIEDVQKAFANSPRWSEAPSTSIIPPPDPKLLDPDGTFQDGWFEIAMNDHAAHSWKGFWIRKDGALVEYTFDYALGGETTLTATMRFQSGAYMEQLLANWDTTLEPSRGTENR